MKAATIVALCASILLLLLLVGGGGPDSADTAAPGAERAVIPPVRGPEQGLARPGSTQNGSPRIAGLMSRSDGDSAMERLLTLTSDQLDELDPEIRIELGLEVGEEVLLAHFASFTNSLRSARSTIPDQEGLRARAVQNRGHEGGLLFDSIVKEFEGQMLQQNAMAADILPHIVSEKWSEADFWSEHPNVGLRSMTELDNAEGHLYEIQSSAPVIGNFRLVVTSSDDLQLAAITAEKQAITRRCVYSLREAFGW